MNGLLEFKPCEDCESSQGSTGLLRNMNIALRIDTAVAEMVTFRYSFLPPNHP